ESSRGPMCSAVAGTLARSDSSTAFLPATTSGAFPAPLGLAPDRLASAGPGDAPVALEETDDDPPLLARRCAGRPGRRYAGGGGPRALGPPLPGPAGARARFPRLGAPARPGPCLPPASLGHRRSSHLGPRRVSSTAIPASASSSLIASAAA